MRGGVHCGCHQWSILLLDNKHGVVLSSHHLHTPRCIHPSTNSYTRSLEYSIKKKSWYLDYIFTSGYLQTTTTTTITTTTTRKPGCRSASVGAPPSGQRWVGGCWVRSGLKWDNKCETSEKYLSPSGEVSCCPYLSTRELLPFLVN